MQRDRKYTPVELGEDELDYAAYLDKAPTSLHTHYADWLIDKTGIEFGTKAAEKAFRDGTRLSTALRMPYQRSPENHIRHEEDAARREDEREARREAAAERKAAKAEAKAETNGEAPAPKRRGRPAKPVADAEPARPVRRGRPAAKAAAAAPATAPTSARKPPRRGRPVAKPAETDF